MTHINFAQLLTRKWRRMFGSRHPDSSPMHTDGRPPDQQAIPNHAFSNSRDEIFALTLARLDLGEREQYFSLAELIAARPSQFLYELVSFKEALTARLPIRDAFEIIRALLKLPSGATIEYRHVKSLLDVAAEHAIVYRETAASGITFTVRPPRVIGTGDHRPFECVTRSLYFACLADACVRGRSAFIDFRGAALLDFQGEEFNRVDDRLILDLPVLQASKEAVWISDAQGEEMKLDEAFNLLGPHTPQFGHWIWEYMPKYVAATMSADISGVPVLIDADMPKTHRQFLQLVLPADTEVIEVPYSMSVRVQRLWCAPRLFYIPLYPKTVDPLLLINRTAPPDRFAAVIREMWRRMEPALPATNGPERVFFARKPDQQRKLVNQTVIAACAEKGGFVVVYPQDLDFADQVRLVHNARYIVGQAGSAMFLNFFASPGTKLCILSSVRIFRSASYTCLLEELGIDTTILTGAIASAHEYAQFDDYSIQQDTFRKFLDDWLLE